MHGHTNVKIVFGVYTKMCRYIPPQVETVQEKPTYDVSNYVNTMSLPMVGHHSSEWLRSLWTKPWDRRNTFKIESVCVRWMR